MFYSDLPPLDAFGIDSGHIWPHGPVSPGDRFVEVDEFGGVGEVWIVASVVAVGGVGREPREMRRSGSTKKILFSDLKDKQLRRA